MAKWSYICPCCDSKIETDSDEDLIRDYYIFCLAACPKCLEILRINPDLTTSDFSKIVEENKNGKGKTYLGESDKVSVFHIQ